MRWLQVSGIFKGKRSLNYPSFANEIWGPFNFKINQIKTKKVLFFYTIKKKKIERTDKILWFTFR